MRMPVRIVGAAAGNITSNALRAAPTPLAFWRSKRAVSTSDLARQAGVPEELVNAVERGESIGDVRLYRRLARALGAESETLMGLSGLGDLVLTCTGEASRNRTVGVRLGRGESLASILADMSAVAEGVKTAQAAHDLARREGVEMPIIEQVRAIPADAIIVRQNWLRAYEFTTDRGAAALNDYARANDPFTRVGRQQIAVDVSSVIRASPGSFRVACITNNMKSGEGPGMSRTPEKARAVAEIMTLFEHVVESSKLGWRKPDPRIYRHACDLLGVAPEHCIYLDDLGINLKPARAMGMRTIKVGDPDVVHGEGWDGGRRRAGVRCR